MFIKRSIIVITAIFCISLSATTPPAQHVLTLILEGKYTEAEQLYKKLPLLDISQSDAYAYAGYTASAERAKEYAQSYQNQPLAAKNSFLAICDKEREEDTSGRYTFFDEQPWDHEWAATLYKALYEAITNDTVPAHYQFLLFKDPLSLKKIDENDLYQKLKKYDTAENARDNRHRRYLYVGESILVDSTGPGNPLRSQPGSKKLFRRCGIRKLYNRYQQELEQLKKEHQQLTQNSCLRLISLSPQHCKENILVFSRNSKPVTGTAPANLELLKSDPMCATKAIKNNEYRYSLILTRNKTLVPSDHIRVWFFSDIEPTKWAVFCAKRDALFARIKQDCILHKRADALHIGPE